MTNIVLIDDVDDNLLALEVQIEEYLEDNNLDFNEYEITSFNKSKDGLEYLLNNKSDIVFLDIMMPELNGLDLLQQLRNSTIAHQPIVVMATALGDMHTKQKEQRYGANAYMVKPISYKVIALMLNKYLSVLKEETFNVDDEFDFDFDFDESEMETQNEDENLSVEEAFHAYGYTSDLLTKIIAKQNDYEIISAQEFMANYEWNIETIEAHLEDLDYTTFKIFSSLDSDIKEQDIDIEADFGNIEELVNEFKEFTVNFEELKDLQVILNFLYNNLSEVDLSQYGQNQKKFLGIFIKAIITDLIELKDNIFVEQNISNIYYLNASIASSCLELNNFLHN